jgi:hypothetical protein
MNKKEFIQRQKSALEKSIWKPEMFPRYSFELSPDVPVFSAEQKVEIQWINHIIFSVNGYLHGAIKLYKDLKDNEKLRNDVTGRNIWKALNNGIGKHELRIQAQFNQLPIFARCDLMSVLPTGEHSPLFQIAEVEGDKTHGMGYYDGFIHKNNVDITGSVNGYTFTDAVKASVGNETVILLVGDKEQFYLPEMDKLLLPEAIVKGLNLRVATEGQLRLTQDRELPIEVGGVKARWMINMPELNPDGELVKPKGGKNLYDLYADGSVLCLIPPNRFLGNKALMGVVSNGLNDPKIDRWIEGYFKWELGLLRHFIPRTIMVTKGNLAQVIEILESQPDDWVIKKTVSSGAKGVSLGDDIAQRTRMMSELVAAPFNYIVQKKVLQVPQSFWHADPSTMELKFTPMYTRTELYTQFGDPLTVGITARASKAVHVQHDAIQIPVIF